MIKQIILIVLVVSSGTDAFTVLVLAPTPFFSHQRPIMAITKGLVQGGHKLFVVSPNAVPELERNENYTFVDVSFLYEFVAARSGKGNVSFQRKLSKWELTSENNPLAGIPKQQFLSEPFLNFKRRVEVENIKFDAIILQSVYIPYLVPMARILANDTPIISISSYVMDYLTEDALGSIVNLSFLPSIFGHYTNRMNLWQKLENWFSHYYVTKRIIGPIESYSKKYFKENYGLMAENLVNTCWKEISLTLVTSNSLYYYPRLLGPNVIEVGPLHLKPPRNLQKNLQDWLDGAEKGVLYFSLGSNMKSAYLPADVRENFLKFFRELPAGYRVLWKWEQNGTILGQPDNILTQSWIPQDSVLAHPKVRLFITHGGLQSFQEAVHFGVPTVSIPWFMDQECVTAKMVDAKIGLRLSPLDIHSFHKIKSVIEAALFDESFLTNMRKLSTISHDFTSQALDKAMFWVEHVARHGGASHLKPATADSTLFEYFCLDIVTVIIVLSSIILLIICSIIRCIISAVTKRSDRKIKKS